MGGKNKQNKQQKKKQASRQQNDTRQKEKQEERKTKRERKREKNKFNKAKYDSDMTKFRLQLAQYGLKVYEMGSDGNCLFRTIADQLEGNEKLHRKYRQEAIDYIELNKDMFAPFIEDDETIDQYLSDLSKDGTWGGQLELTALSQIYKFNYIVHQVDNPIMAFSNYPWGTVPTLHLSYHLGEHYNSVRLLEDPCNGPPLPIGHELQIKENVQLPVPEEIKDDKFNDKTLKDDRSDEIPTRETIISYALTISGFTNEDLMTQTLKECFGDDQNLNYETIELSLEALRRIYEDLELQKLQVNFTNKLSLDIKAESNFDGELTTLKNGSSKSISHSKEKNAKQSKETRLKELQKDDMIVDAQGEIKQMPSKNKKCPCGSKKPYKNCKCYVDDLQRKTQEIEKITKKIDQHHNKQQNILLL